MTRGHLPAAFFTFASLILECSVGQSTTSVDDNGHHCQINSGFFWFCNLKPLQKTHKKTKSWSFAEEHHHHPHSEMADNKDDSDKDYGTVWHATWPGEPNAWPSTGEKLKTHNNWSSRSLDGVWPDFFTVTWGSHLLWEWVGDPDYSSASTPLIAKLS